MTLDQGQAPSDGQLEILLAEDNPVNQRLAELILGRLGHQLDIVENGAEAVRAALAKSYAVILMDVEMPGMDGLEATRQIRAHFGDRERPYIVAMTASGERAQCLDAGMDDYLRKPVRTADLIGMVERALAVAADWRSQQHFRRD